MEYYIDLSKFFSGLGLLIDILSIKDKKISYRNIVVPLSF